MAWLQLTKCQCVAMRPHPHCSTCNARWTPTTCRGSRRKSTLRLHVPALIPTYIICAPWLCTLPLYVVENIDGGCPTAGHCKRLLVSNMKRTDPSRHSLLSGHQAPPINGLSGDGATDGFCAMPLNAAGGEGIVGHKYTRWQYVPQLKHDLTAYVGIGVGVLCNVCMALEKVQEGNILLQIIRTALFVWRRVDLRSVR